MRARRLGRRLVGYVVAVSAACVATAVIVALNHYVTIPNISLLYLPVILITAVYFGTGPSLVAATLAVLEYDFFLLQPIFTFTIAQVQDILAFVIFVIVAILTGQLAARARERAEDAQRRAAESTMLYELGQALMTVHETPEVLQVITRHMVDIFGVDRCAIFVPDAAGRLQLAAETLEHPRQRDRASQAAAAYAYERGHGVTLPIDQPDTPGRRRIYVALRTADRSVGVMEVGPKRSGEVLDADVQRLVTSFAAQAALAIARAQGDAERQRLEVLEQSDRLKSALLSAVSHDLRTPLASIKASATALLLSDTPWTVDEGREFLVAIDHEADRLNRLVGNLLDLSRIEAGVLRPALDWYDMQEVIATILPRVRLLLSDRPLEVDLQPGASLVLLDLSRIEALVSNLVENAVKYTPPASPIALRAWHDAAGVHIAVADRGPGVPEAHRKRIFDTFYRVNEHSDRNPGTGLGLAICRGVAEAHGGTIQVEDTPGGGATFIVTLPHAPSGRELVVAP
jgi:two-component system sensor histidine kinase KdpD